jgi:hypothetical protein
VVVEAVSKRSKQEAREIGAPRLFVKCPSSGVVLKDRAAELKCPNPDCQAAWALWLVTVPDHWQEPYQQRSTPHTRNK